MTWVDVAAARLGLPVEGEFSLARTVYPTPTRWAKCPGCGSTTWNLAAGTAEAADQAEVHAAFCRRLP